MKCKAVFFDLWDTLIESFAIGRETQKIMGLDNYSFKFFIRRFEKATMLREFGSLDDFFSAGFKALSLEPDKNKIKKLSALWLQNVKSARAFPETMRVLRALKSRGFKLAIVSNCQYFGTRKLLKRLGFEGLFDSISLSFEAHSLKPGKRIFQRALKELKLKPREAVMVGDSDTDMKGAGNAGMRGILIERNPRARNLPRAFAVTRSLKELPGLLELV